MKLDTFLALYDKESKNAIYVQSTHKHKYLYRIDGSLYVNERALLNRRAFYAKIWNLSHTNYYRFILEGIKESKVAELLAKYTEYSKNSWIMFMQSDLFSMAFRDKSLLSYKITTKLWIFYRITTLFIRVTERKLK